MFFIFHKPGSKNHIFNKLTHQNTTFPFYFVCKPPPCCHPYSLSHACHPLHQVRVATVSKVQPLHVNKDPLDSKSLTVNLAIYFFSFFLIQTIPIFSPHHRPLFSIKYIIYLYYIIILFVKWTKIVIFNKI